MIFVGLTRRKMSKNENTVARFVVLCYKKQQKLLKLVKK
jgi:hypothetical protein